MRLLFLVRRWWKFWRCEGHLSSTSLFLHFHSSSTSFSSFPTLCDIIHDRTIFHMPPSLYLLTHCFLHLHSPTFPFSTSHYPFPLVSSSFSHCLGNTLIIGRSASVCVCDLQADMSVTVRTSLRGTLLQLCSLPSDAAILKKWTHICVFQVCLPLASLCSSQIRLMAARPSCSSLPPKRVQHASRLKQCLTSG